MHRDVASALGVLQQCNHEEGDDRRGRVDDELLRVHVAEERVARHPERHEQHAGDEEARVARKLRRGFGESVEETAALVPGRHRSTFARAVLPPLAGAARRPADARLT